MQSTRIEIIDFLRLMHSTGQYLDKEYDVGSFLESHNYLRDISQITLSNLESCVEDWETTEIVEYIDANDLSFLFTEEDPDVSFNVSEMGFGNIDVIYKSTLRQMVESLYSQSTLVDLILARKNIGEYIEFAGCTIKGCVFSTEVTSYGDRLVFTRCNIEDTSLHGANSIVTISNCDGDGISLYGLSSISISQSDLKRLKVKNSNFVGGIKMTNTILEQSCFKNNKFHAMHIHDVDGMNSENCSANTFYDKDNLVNAGCAWDYYLNKDVKSSDPDILVIAVAYAFYNGNTIDMLLKHYVDRQQQDDMESKGCRVIYLDVTKPFDNIVNDLNSLRINMVLLAGGENVPSDYYIIPTKYYDVNVPVPGIHPRSNFEINLLRWAESKSINVVGICRGLQIMAVYKGMQLMDIDGSVEHCQKSNFVVSNADPFKESVIYNECLRKFNKHPNSFYKYGMPINDESGNLTGFAFKKKCIHSQSINPKSLNSSINITGRADDDVIECAEFESAHGSLMLGWQSHPERIYEEHKMSKAFIKLSISIAGNDLPSSHNNEFSFVPIEHANLKEARLKRSRSDFYFQYNEQARKSPRLSLGESDLVRNRRDSLPFFNAQ